MVTPIFTAIYPLWTGFDPAAVNFGAADVERERDLYARDTTRIRSISREAGHGLPPQAIGQAREIAPRGFSMWWEGGFGILGGGGNRSGSPQFARSTGDGHASGSAREIMIDYAFRKLRARDDVSADEEKVLRSAISHIVDVGKDVTFVKADVALTNSNILIDGFVCRYRDMANGERQVTELHVPGDFVDLHSFPLQRLDHHIMALVPSRVAVVPHEKLRAITETEPHLTRLLWLATAMDAAIHREWMVSIGRRSALARIAHMLCELYERLKVVGLIDGLSYALPLTQIDIAECLGLTPIHVNRTLRTLRLQKLVTFRSKRVLIEDLPGLRAIAEFDENYLFLDKHPR